MALEERLAKLFSYDEQADSTQTAALLFNSGYDANVSFFSAVPQKGDFIVYDELVHASVWDGMRANARRGVTEARRVKFDHNSLLDFEKQLSNIATRIETERSSSLIYIALESLYSMDGDLTPLLDLLDCLEDLARRHPLIIHPARVCVILDEAHTTGALGERGRGLAWHLSHQPWGRDEQLVKRGQNVRKWVQVRVMTFGKAVGSQGGEHLLSNKNVSTVAPIHNPFVCLGFTAVVIASPTIKQFLINYARPFIFSTAMSVNNVLAIQSAWDVLESEEGEKASVNHDQSTMAVG